MFANKIIDSFNLNRQDIIHIFGYGSRVYQTYSDSSDYDFIVVVKDGSMDNEFALDKNNLSIHIFNESLFNQHLQNHKISQMECYFLPKDFVYLSNNKLQFSLNLAKLRSSISEKSSHSFVKAKKKFEVEKDRNIYIAKKSLFHSLRIIDFGIQIAKNKTISDYTCSNHLWNEIKDNNSEDWQDYKDKYQELYNLKMTEFRKIAPK